MRTYEEAFFWLADARIDADGKTRVCPIEVKSPRQYGTTSLDCFEEKFGKQIGTRYVFHPKQLKVEDDRRYLPLYMGFCL